MASRNQPSGDAKSAATEAPPSAALKPSEVLSKAADLIEPEGAWTQGRYGVPVDPEEQESPYLCLCLYGAVEQATRASHLVQDPWPFVLAALHRSHPGDAIRWNDATGRTQPEVVAALRKAADLARSEGQ